MAAIGLDRGLNYLKDKLTPLIEGPDGIAADCSRVIGQYVDQHPDRVDRMLAIIGRAGGMYPFYRSSALLKHLDGKTRQCPGRPAVSGPTARSNRPVAHGHHQSG